MSGRVEATGEPSPGASPPAQENATEQRKRTKIIFVVYVIVALDVTWMFLQFSVTPVSISVMCLE